jgi:hypothetical protein
LFGRAHGVAHIRDRGFTALYTRSAFGQEIVGVRLPRSSACQYV